MKLGWCGPIENAAIIAKAGLDFIEVPLAPFGLEDRTSLAAAKKAIAASPLPTLAFNLFLPRDMRVVGADVDLDRVKSYLGRAAELLAWHNRRSSYSVAVGREMSQTVLIVTRRKPSSSIHYTGPPKL